MNEHEMDAKKREKRFRIARRLYDDIVEKMALIDSLELHEADRALLFGSLKELAVINAR